MDNTFVQEDVLRFSSSFSLAEELKNCHVLITGATGLLGSIATYCLLSLNETKNLGMKISVLIRNKDKAECLFADKVSYYIADLNVAQELPKITDSIDYILHFASPTASLTFVQHPVYTIQTILNGTNLLLEFARNHSIKSMVFVSSLEVYGTIHDDKIVVSEAEQGYLDPMSVRTSYPMAKRLCECLCASYASEYGVPVRVGRLTQTFGCGIAPDDNRVFALFARSVVQGKDIVLHTKGDLSRPYLYTTDAVSALLYILLRGQDGEAYNVANDESYISIRDMAEFLCAEFNPNINVCMEFGDYGYLPPTKLRLSSEKIMKLGWTPSYSLKQMFERLINSLK